MNETLASLFDETAKVSKALGCGVRLPDRTNRVRSFNHECPEDSIEKALLHLTGTVALLASQDLVGRQLRWTFAAGKLHVAIRDDGAMFCVIARKEAGITEVFDRLLDQFLATT